MVMLVTDSDIQMKTSGLVERRCGTVEEKMFCNIQVESLVESRGKSQSWRNLFEYYLLRNDTSSVTETWKIR